jgi:hypothetical protein
MTSTHRATCAWPSRLRKIQGANWKCTIPSFPAVRSGSSESLKRCQIASRSGVGTSLK